MNPIPPNSQTDGVDRETARLLRSAMAAGRHHIVTMEPDAMTAYRDGALDTQATLPTREWTVRRARGGEFPHRWEWDVATDGIDQVAGPSRMTTR